MAPITADLDKVRLLIGDTDTSDLLLTDDQVNYFISDKGTVELAAAAAAEAIAAKLARKFKFATDGQSFELQQQYEHYMALAKSLRSRADGGLGSIEVSRHDGYSQDISSADVATTPDTGRTRRGWWGDDLPS